MQSYTTQHDQIAYHSEKGEKNPHILYNGMTIWIAS